MARPPLPRQSVIQPLDTSYRFIPLTQNKVAIVDVEDFAWLSKWNWHAKENANGYYAARTDWDHKIFMHREILKCRKNQEGDHKNGNTLDNRRTNLRSSTHRQNGCNVAMPRTNTSGFKGVSWDKRRAKWRGYIVSNQKQIHLGMFASKEEAACAYNIAALKLHGKFARLNESIPCKSYDGPLDSRLG